MALAEAFQYKTAILHSADYQLAGLAGGFD
jgi:hypothetical protein